MTCRSRTPEGQREYWKKYRATKFPYTQKACIFCGASFEGVSGSVKSCEKCRTSVCAFCGKTFERRRIAEKLCSKGCYTNSQKGKPAYPNLVGKRGTKPRTYHLRKRAKHAGAQYQEWRKSVFERDKYTCVLCGQKGGRLNADHIKPYAKYPRLRYALKNGRTLCIPCHKKTDSYGWAKYWKNYIKKPKYDASQRLAQEVLPL